MHGGGEGRANLKTCYLIATIGGRSREAKGEAEGGEVEGEEVEEQEVEEQEVEEQEA
jgi:hypothetical protein